jgi:hypothetical protein
LSTTPLYYYETSRFFKCYFLDLLFAIININFFEAIIYYPNHIGLLHFAIVFGIKTFNLIKPNIIPNVELVIISFYLNIIQAIHCISFIFFLYQQ